MTLKTVTSFKRPVLQSLYSCLNFINSTQHPTSCSKYSHCKRTSSLSKLAGAYIQRRSICSRLLTSKEQQHGVQKVLLNLENRRHVISFHYFTNLRRQRSTHAILSSSLIQPSRFRDFLLESWFFEVSTFGKLKLNCHFPTRVEILDPQEFPDQNKANVYLLHEDILESDESEGVVDAPPVQRLRDIYRFNIEVNEKTSEINIRTDLPSGVSLPLMCLIQIPVKFNLDVNSKSDILVKEFESERIKVVSQNGNCHLSEIKVKCNFEPKGCQSVILSPLDINKTASSE